jgi:NADH:ubiquinone oxidoreductase subunit 3 (subunit A)
MPSDYVPILIFAVVAVALSAIAVLVPALFGPKHPPWATVFRELSPRWVGLLEAGIFVGILVLGLIYVWKKGGLEWE